MGCVVLFRLLDASLLLVALELLALLELIVGGRVLRAPPAKHAQHDAKRTPAQRAEGRATGGRLADKSRQFIEPLPVHWCLSFVG
jgi:hypothetical protein